MAGTPNGIALDPKSKLVFSPSHFTWMDTNFPAGTPREGYPIEIQALWYAALEFLGEEDRTLRSLADEVAAGIERLFFTHPDGRCADCLHAGAGTPAANAASTVAASSGRCFAGAKSTDACQHPSTPSIRPSQRVAEQRSVTATACRPAGSVEARRLKSNPFSPIL